MDSKNVQKTRFYACLKTKSLYTVIEKMLKTHLKGLCLFVSQQTKIIMLFKIDRFIGRPLDFLILDIYKCPKMDSTRLSFLGSLKNNFVKMQNVFRPFVVRELRGFEMLFFRKNQKIPKKEENSKKPLRHL
jgi:hypothetical protein